MKKSNPLIQETQRSLTRIMPESIYKNWPRSFYSLYLCTFAMWLCRSLHQEVEFIPPPSDLGLFWPIEDSRSNMSALSTDFKRICDLLEPEILPHELVQANLLDGASLVAQMVKNLSAMQETRLWCLGWEDPFKRMATHWSILAWRIPWTEEPGGLQPMGLYRVGPNWTTFTCTTFWIIR